jgi:hypothetical protein
MKKNSEVIQKPKNAREFFRSGYFWKPFLGVAIGGVAGFLYFYFIGCTSGTCPITSHLYSSIMAGGVLGYLITGAF